MTLKLKSPFKEGSLASSVLLAARTPIGMVSFCIIGGLVLLAILPGVFSPYDPLQLNLTDRLSTPSFNHLLGTDDLGRDILSRIIYGATISLQIGIIVTSIGASVGVVLGASAGYFGGKVEVLIMRIVDMVLAMPGLVLAIGVLGIIGASITNLMFILSVYFWPSYARIARGLTLKFKEMEYVQAAIVIGMKPRRIIFREIVPNILPEVIILATLNMGTAILWEAGLSFLGLGVPPPNPSWGNMLSTGRAYLTRAPHVALFPGFAITLTILGFNLLGDQLRDTLDPRLRR